MLKNLTLVSCTIVSLVLTYLGGANLDEAPLLPLLLVYAGGVFSMATVCMIGD